MHQSVNPKRVAALCRKYGPQLRLEATDDGTGQPINGMRLLWALAGNESSFGANCTPRFEPSYYTDGAYYRHSARVRELVALYDREGASSFGPWQLLLVNTKLTPAQMADPEMACQATVEFINRYIISLQRASTLSQIADAYNSGSWRDLHVPEGYVSRLEAHYSTPLPDAPANGMA